MSWLEDHLPDGIKDVLCEPDAPKALAVPQPAQPVTLPWVGSMPMERATVSSPLQSIPSTSIPPSAVTSILADLRAKTDFDATPVGQQLKESLDVLSDSGMSEEKMAKTAMRLTKQSPAQVISVLQSLQNVLVADKQQFEVSMQKATAAEVDARQTQLTQLQSSIEDAESRLNAMRQEKSRVDVDLQEKKTKISSARANYAAASEARHNELAEMISHYQSIPEGK